MCATFLTSPCDSERGTLGGWRSKNWPERSRSDKRILAGLIIIVCILLLLAHLPALSSGAHCFDDNTYLTNNTLVKNPGWASAKRFLTEVLEPSTVKGYYQPLTMISLMLDCAMGAKPDYLVPFHRTSLALHLINTALIILLLHQLFGRVWASAGVGLLFGVHPITVETIVWVSERKTLLAAFFALWCLIFYVRYVRKDDWRFYAGCIITYVLAVMSKPISLPVPVLMLLLDYWPLRRLRLRAILEKLPFFTVGGIFAIITYISQGRTAFVELPTEYGLERIPLILCHNIIFYIYKILWPVNLSPHYGFPKTLGLSDPSVLAGVIGTCVLVALLAISMCWTRALLTGWLFFFLAILPTMQIVAFTNVIASDKFAYLPFVGLLMVLVSFVDWLSNKEVLSKFLRWRVVAVMIILILAGAEAVATRRNLAHWRNTLGLFEYMLTLKPDASVLHHDIGLILQAEKRPEEAISHFRQALQIQPDFAVAHNNLAVVLFSQGKCNEAISHYRQALQIKPDYPYAHFNLGNALQSQGNFEEAIDHYRQALRLEPEYPEVYDSLGILSASQGKLEEAIGHFSRAIQIKPNHGPSHYNLGLALLRTGHLNMAFRHFEQAAHLMSESPMPLTRMAWLLATHPDRETRSPTEAIRLLQRASGLMKEKHRDAYVLDALAAAYAAAGQFDAAVRTADRAIAVATSRHDYDQANQIRQRLQLYAEGKPYRQPAMPAQP